MSPYEILAVLFLAGAGGFAWWLYRKDTRPGPDGRPATPPPPSGEAMFARRPRPPSDRPPDAPP
jgi:hypothetical protein